MTADGGFVAHVLELLSPCGRAEAKRMFGGHGVYLDGLFIAIIADDELYLKADALSRGRFEDEGCAPFVYVKRGKTMTMSFWRAPGEALDAPHLMQPWARLALAAALRARSGPRKPQKKTGRKSRPD
jgi:DNA transformation protein